MACSVSYAFAARVFFGVSSASAAVLRAGFFLVAVMDAVFVFAAGFSEVFTGFAAVFAAVVFSSAVLFAAGFLDVAFLTGFSSAVAAVFPVCS